MSSFLNKITKKDYQSMKYLKRYESFMNQAFNDVNINIDKSLSIVEKQVLNDFSVSFWDLSMNSSVFTNEEKTFIKENLMTNKVDLVQIVGENFTMNTLRSLAVKLTTLQN